MNKIKIGLLGCGTVGSGVIQALEKNKATIAAKVGAELEITKVLVRDINKKRDLKNGTISFTCNIDEIINDPEIKIVVEVMGGISPAKEYVLQALKHGKSVVTANKDLMALHGKDLFEAANLGNVDLRFEASVGGGIPIIGPLKTSLAGNQILKVVGIINGTTNYILTKMAKEKSEFNKVLAEAQRLGYAESDPTADIEGLDAARKIAILASIAFNSRVTFPKVYVEGITKITTRDICYANELGYTIKLLGIAQQNNGTIEVRVHPAFIPNEHPLAKVDDVFNAIYVQGDAVGDAMFYGRGAGQLPTASAVIGDLMEVARNLTQGIFDKSYCTCFEHKEIKPFREIKTKYYLRLTVPDRPGVLASIASVFAQHEVSIASVVQKRKTKQAAELVLITHLVKEAYLQDALSAIQDLPFVTQINNVIRVEDLDDEVRVGE
ncbi:MAG: homoserine dehydrogenase [Zhaonellaceae bacterium]|jgi:homoserine dehydrogenase|nr:homoserine dehydrogenase [Clostridia bacterium]